MTAGRSEAADRLQRLRLWVRVNLGLGLVILGYLFNAIL